MELSLRESIDQDKLEYLDSIAQIVAGLYQDNVTAEHLGQEVPELQKAVYTLGQAYMLLYNELLKGEDT